jgi:hypothetical protein
MYPVATRKIFAEMEFHTIQTTNGDKIRRTKTHGFQKKAPVAFFLRSMWAKIMETPINPIIERAITNRLLMIHSMEGFAAHLWRLLK